jgi:hypothetical protein
MSKPVFGLILGGALGILDGLTAWFTPEVRAQILTIVIGSTFKGMIAGICIGWFSKKVNSLPLGLVFGLGVGMLLPTPSPRCPSLQEITITSKSCCPALWWAQSSAMPLRNTAARHKHFWNQSNL